mgnify:CR=1 FL=1
MKKITLLLAFFILDFLPTIVFAKMGYLFPEDEYGSGGGFDIFGFIALMLVAGWFYKTFIEDILKWKERRRNKEKFDFSAIKEGFGGALFIYALRGIFLALPVVVIINWIGGYAFVKDFWLFIFIGIIAIQFVFSDL